MALLAEDLGVGLELVPYELEDPLEGLEAGADAYLTKQTLDARELVALVRRVGGGR